MTHLEKFQEKLAALGEAALISSPQNIFYLSHFAYDDGYLLIFPDGAYLLADFRYIEAARASAAEGFTVLCPEGTMTDAVRELLAKRGTKSLVLEEDHVRLSLHRRLCDTLEDVELCTGASRTLSALRMYKDGNELAAISTAQEITDAAFAHILSYLHAGLREIDVALELEHFMRQNGAEGLAFDTIAVSGSASSLPHGVPRDRVLEKGFLTMDFGARYGGYCADMTRTVVIGRADDEMKHLYQTVLTAQRAALDAAKGGISCKALDKIARDIIGNAGYHGTFGHSLGHGVGIDIHEAPRLGPSVAEDEVLCPGHVVTVEPGIYLAGRYGCRIEDLIAIRTDGTVHNFTKSPKELIEI
ncbi:MAG: aminopeptidase P family protein [Clostridia bacterium]|nr:aminopeptidase P family protein [Clostridia bacterium]